MTQAFEYGHQSHKESRQENIDWYKTLRTCQRVVVTQNKRLHAHVDQICDETGRQWRHDPTRNDRANFAPLHCINTNTNSGKTYDCYMWFEDDSKVLYMKGFVLGMRMLGRSSAWKKENDRSK